MDGAGSTGPIAGRPDHWWWVSVDRAAIAPDRVGEPIARRKNAAHIMKPVLALRQVPHEGLGSLEEVLRQHGLVWSYVDLFHDVPRTFNPAQLAGLVVLGGPMNVDQTDRYPFLAREVEWIAAALADRLPVLGICLGSQLLAKSLGAPVAANPVKEIGWYDVELLPAAADDLLLAGSQPLERVFQWHGDMFDLPAGAIHLARSPACQHQAFRYGRCAWGLQFHVEVTDTDVCRWLDVPENCAELERLDGFDAERIRSRLPDELPAMRRFAERLLPRFAELCHRRAEQQ